MPPPSMTSMPMLRGSRPASSACRRIRPSNSSASMPGRNCGNQPSASRPTRSTRRGSIPPSQTGMRRRAGSGFTPASVTECQRPLKLMAGLLHSSRSNSICSSERLPRLLKLSPSASYSTAFQPVPTPKRSRPADSTSSEAACLATNAVWRCGRMMTAVTSSSVVVIEAMNANSTNGS